MKLLKQYFAVLCVAFSTVAVANVSGEMFQMNREVNQLLKADSVEAFQQSADKFLTAAKKSARNHAEKLRRRSNPFCRLSERNAGSD